ncbi:OB-fold domain-containing protein [Leptospira sp. GIMC2001]|uniref:OB-fold domain-containing protein n=1 Tax=Leptospira sp. GIMC2001 TaxID=1513297 RepID=UPI00234A2E64|nr:OB-fold domain-containing protein [Leptospira sp. GIMC2001]WCL49373.1 OB-fold domain-containing protein [Leptospira sp. GIMC2001]
MEDLSKTQEKSDFELPQEISGVIYSFTIVHVGFGHMADKVPYALCQIQKDDGSMQMEIFEDQELLQDLRIGQSVILQKNKAGFTLNF